MSDPRAIRELRQATAQASNRQLLKLTQVLDALPERGSADTLLDAARPRLKHLRPSRPMSVARLLFLPLDPLIVPPRGWKPGQGALPRSALAPLVRALRDAQPKLLADVEARLAGQDFQAVALLREAGAGLWQAACAMPRGVPAGWADSGLPDHVFPELAGICGTIWRHAPALLRLRLAGADGPPESLARPAFRLIAAEGGEAVGLCLRALLPYAAKPARLAAIIAGLGAALAPAAERALDIYLEGVEPELDATDLSTTAAVAARFAALLEDLDQSVTRDKPRRAQQLQALRLAAAKACAERLRGELALRLSQPLDALLADPAPADAAIEALELAAMALRGLGDSGRRLYAPSSAERIFDPSIARLGRLAGSLPQTGPGFLRNDALRLLQILAGSAEAARMG